MHIGIDARLINQTGVGRYIRNLLRELAVIDTINTYAIFLPPDEFDAFRLPNSRWKKYCIGVRWHTFAEQIVMPFWYLKTKCDVVHIPYYSIPILYPKPFVVTIHDLIILHINTGKASSLPNVLYQLKRWGYQWMLNIGLRRATYVIAVSETVKQEISEHFHVPSSKVIVSYEGVDPNITVSKDTPSQDILAYTSHPYMMYVGNAYPHKNIDWLCDAFVTWSRKQLHATLKLLCIGPDDRFYRILKRQYAGSSTPIHFLHGIDDSDMIWLYKHASAFVTPTRMEGFGLPVLEALALQCPVVVSDIPVFHELFGSIPIYFNPTDKASVQSLFDRITQGDIPKPHAFDPSKFSWETLARTTLAVYHEAV